MPSKNESPLLSPKFALALQFANEIHSRQVRKGIGAPYISHLMAVCALVLEYGGDETQAISALLHDSAEDCGGRPMLDAVRLMFGDEVRVAPYYHRGYTILTKPYVQRAYPTFAPVNWDTWRIEQ